MQKQMTIPEYTEAVKNLLPLAQGDTGGSRIAAMVLLSAYNGREFPLDITELCGLDLDHYFDAMIVIRGRVELQTEPQTLIKDGSRIFESLWQNWKGYHISKRWQLYE
ncbi:MAG: hypothetical protein KJ804_12155 [Proteobacteria bacterium]|nr:hypothetical protein [Pseudomonadota bacterium]MBU1059056.1 hypothetical protein [Pseudomonadota bacterium]